MQRKQKFPHLVRGNTQRRMRTRLDETRIVLMAQFIQGRYFRQSLKQTWSTFAYTDIM